MFDSIYSIALDILNKVHGDATQHFDSNFAIALAILNAIGGDATQNFDSVYSILKEIYKVRFGSVLVDMDSVYAIAEAINHALDDTDNTLYDSTYAILLHVDENPALLGHKFSIVTDSANTVIINGQHIREQYFEEGDVVTWSVSRTGYVTQSGTYTMSDEDYELEITLVLDQFTVTITPVPADATVVINGVERDTFTADYGTTINYSVSAEHYETKTGTFILYEDTDLTVDLSIDQYTFAISTDANNTVVINGMERTSITADYGSTITWSVSREGYVTQSDTHTLVADYTESVALVKQTFLFTINATPNDATVVINGVEQSSKTVEWGDTVSWSVTRTGYNSQSGSEVVTSAVTKNISLVIMQFTFSVSVTPNDATVVINGVERSTFTADYGTSITWSVSKTGYVSQNGSYTLESDHTESVSLVKQTFLFTINTTPNDATVIIDGVEQSSKTVEYGDSVSWSVSRTGYTSQSGSEVVTSTVTKNISLVIMQFTFTINPTPADAIVTINGSQRTSITADYGTTINWSVTKTGYTTQSGTETLTETYSMNINLSMSNHTFTIEATPADATVVINGEERTSYTAPYGTAITWSVSKSHYITQTGSYTLTGDHYETVELALDSHTFTVAATPNDATVVINGQERSSITAVHGTAITWSVSKTGYVTQSGTYTLNDDHTETVTLVLAQFTVAITPTPNDATVEINSVERSTFTADYGTTINWSVSKSHYITQTGTFTLEQDVTIPVTLSLDSHTFTISATPNDATVIINGEERSSITAVHGTTITWSVSRTGYISQSGSYTLNDDHTETVTLALDSFTVTIVPTPNDATVMINGNISSTYTGTYGSAVTWSVGKTGYNTQTGMLTLEQDTTIPVTLVISQKTFTIDTDPANTVIINNVERSSITADYGTEITWYVLRTNYTTQTGTYTLTTDHTETVVLSLVQYTFTIVPTPADATVMINGVAQSSLTADYGTAISWEVSKTGYTTQTGSYNLTQDHTENVTLVSAMSSITFNKGNANVKLVVNGNYLGTDAASHTVLADPGTQIHWEAYRAGYATKKGDLVANGDQTVDASLSVAKFVAGYATSNPTIKYWNGSSYTNFSITRNSDGFFYSSVSTLPNANCAITDSSLDTTSLSYISSLRFEHIDSNTKSVRYPCSVAYAPNYYKIDNISIDSAVRVSGQEAMASLNQFKIYQVNGINHYYSVPVLTMNNCDFSQSTVDSLNQLIGKTWLASNDGSATYTINDYPFRLKEVHMNCWDYMFSIPTTVNKVRLYQVQDGKNANPGNTTRLWAFVKTTMTEFYAYGWTSANIENLKGQFNMYATELSAGGSFRYYTFAGIGVIRIWIDETHYWQWRLEDEYPTWNDLMPTGTTSKYADCTQWTLVDTQA